MKFGRAADPLNFLLREARGVLRTMSTNAFTNHSTHPHSTLDPRTQRAIDEPMTVTARDPSTYHVESVSGAIYIVQLPTENSTQTGTDAATCSCPDRANQPVGNGCKHLRRVKLDIACGELPHPDDWPSDAELAEREPMCSPNTSSPMTSSLATDGGQSVSASSSSTSIGASSEIAAEGPTITDERQGGIEHDAPRDICHRISERIREIELEIEQRRGELMDLKTTLAVLEDLVPELNGSEQGR